MSSVSRGSTECPWKHSTNLFLFYHLHYRETTCTPTRQLPSHLLSLSALASGTRQVASYPTFDMFLEYLLWRPTTALHVSLRRLYVDSMRITLPRNPEEWDAVSSGFAKVSRDELFGGCVGAGDGFFQAITCPTVSEVSNQPSYSSGHYEKFGLNCQAICTHDLTSFISELLHLVQRIT